MKSWICALALGLMPLAAPAAEKPQVMFGVVLERGASVAEGVLVQAVRPDSPAQQAGLRPGDVILALNGVELRKREDMRAVLCSMQPGDELNVTLVQAGQRRSLLVPLVARPPRKSSAAASPDAAVGGDRMLRPLVVDAPIRAAMREHRQKVVAQLAAMPEGLEPAVVTEHLQAIRHLARDANPQGKGWMLGEAGEVTLQFRDAAGILVLHGANKMLTLSVYDADGQMVCSLPLDTEEQRRLVPQELIERLRKLR